MASVRREDSRCAPSFWDAYNALPETIRELAKEKHELWLSDTTARSLFFKKLKGQKQEVWQSYVGDDHRALCVKRGDQYVWFWIGTKQDALKLV